MMNIYHHGLGYISEAIDAAIAKCKEQGEPITMCFNGSLATVNELDHAGDVYKNWMTSREDYQSNKRDDHPAVCKECKGKDSPKMKPTNFGKWLGEHKDPTVSNPDILAAWADEFAAFEVRDSLDRIAGLEDVNRSIIAADKNLIDENQRQQQRISELEKVARKAEMLYNNVGNHNSNRKWVSQKHVDDLGFALCDLELAVYKEKQS